MTSTPTDNELKEENPLNFVVNSPDEELSLDLGDDVEVTAEKLYEVLAGASRGCQPWREGSGRAVADW